MDVCDKCVMNVVGCVVVVRIGAGDAGIGTYGDCMMWIAVWMSVDVVGECTEWIGVDGIRCDRDDVLDVIGGMWDSGWNECVQYGSDWGVV